MSWGGLRVNVSCPILVRKYFRGTGSTWRNKILEKELPSEEGIKLVKCMVSLYLAICEHKAKRQPVNVSLKNLQTPRPPIKMMGAISGRGSET